MTHFDASNEAHNLFDEHLAKEFVLVDASGNECPGKDASIGDARQQAVHAVYGVLIRVVDTAVEILL